MKQLVAALFLSTFVSLSAQEATVTINQPEAINKLLEFKKDVKTVVDIYKIQVYSGDSSSRAARVKSEFISRFGVRPVETLFQTPNYKIWVGNFRSRIEAERVFLKIKKKYSKALIIQPRK